MRLAPLALLLLACGGKARPADPPPLPLTETQPPSPDGLAPRPFTPEQIRDAMPVGHEIKMRLDVDGQPPRITVMRAIEADAHGVTMVAEISSEDGTPLMPPQTTTRTWAELAAHASFPAAATVRTEGTVVTAMGKFASIDYRLTVGDTVTFFSFARALPGPPVEITEMKNGQVTQHMVVLSRVTKK